MKKNICFPFEGDNLGGSHIIAINIIKNLKKNNIQPIVVLHKKGRLYEYLKKNKIKFFFLPIKIFNISKKTIFYNFFSILIIFLKITFFLKKNKIQIVHTNTANMHILWLFPAKFIKSKIYWHIHTRFPSWPLFNFLSRKVDKFIAVSNYVLKSFPSKLQKKTFLLNNAIKTNNLFSDKSRTTIRLKKRLGINKEYKIILFLANFYQRKQPLIFIKIAKKILNLYKKKVFFLMVGDDRNISREMLLQKIKKLNLYNNFCLLKFQDNKDFIISASDILLVTSTNEPFGLTLIEAMSKKTPVIASMSGGHKEIIINNYNGVLVNKNDINMFAKKTIELLEKDKLRKKIINNAKIYLKKNNNFNYYLTKLVKIYNND